MSRILQAGLLLLSIHNISLAVDAAATHDSRFMATSWIEVNEQYQPVEPALKFRGDFIRQEIELEDSQRGVMLLTHFEMGTYEGKPCARFDVICKETSMLDGRGAISFRRDGMINTLDVWIKHFADHGRATYEHHLFSPVTNNSKKATYFERILGAFEHLIRESGPKVIAAFLMALIVVIVQRLLKQRNTALSDDSVEEPSHS